MKEKHSAYQRDWKYFSKTANVFAVVAAVATLTMTMFSLFDHDKSRKFFGDSIPDEFNDVKADVVALRADLNSVKESLANTASNLLAVVTNLPPEPRQAAMIVQMSVQVSNVSARIKLLEDAITASPDKALAVPLIRRDLDILQKNASEERAATKAEVDRLYEFNKWFFGLIATMALSTLGMALANIFKKPKDTENGD